MALLRPSNKIEPQGKGLAMLQSTAGIGADVLHARQDKRAWGQRFVFVALGLLLLVTALLKVEGSANGALSQNTILFPPRLRFAVIEVEAILGLWLLSGRARRAAWFFAVAFFLIVAGFSLYLGLMGQSSCGCFGRIHVSPWNAFTLDGMCLALLGWLRPSFPREEREKVVVSQRLREALTIVGGAGAIFAMGLGCVFLAGGSLSGDLLARMRGEWITVEPPVTDIGVDVAGETRRFTVRIHNHTDRAVKIVGGTANCSCLATSDLPVVIPPGQSISLTVVSVFKGSTGVFHHEFTFYTDEDRQKWVLARFKGRIIRGADTEREKTP